MSAELNPYFDHVIRLTKELASGGRPGVLSTTAPDGASRVRWMGTLSISEFPHLYALTSESSRKIVEIRHDARVTWMFTSDAPATVVNIFGRAKIITKQTEVYRIWQLIENKGLAFFMNLENTDETIAVIDTLITAIECVVPRYGFSYSVKEFEISALSGEQDVPA